MSREAIKGRKWGGPFLLLLREKSISNAAQHQRENTNNHVGNETTFYLGSDFKYKARKRLASFLLKANGTIAIYISRVVLERKQSSVFGDETLIQMRDSWYIFITWDNSARKIKDWNSVLVINGSYENDFEWMNG